MQVRSVIGQWRWVAVAVLVFSLMPMADGNKGSVWGTVWGVSPAMAQQGPVIRKIRIVGNRRVEPETVRSYLQFSEGDRYDPYAVDASLKALFATGLFSDVRISRKGGTVTVTLAENPIVNRVAFEGNSEIDDKTLQSEIQLKPRAIYTRAKVQSDVQRILDLYSRQGRFAAGVEPKIIPLPQNRVDLVFEISEGEKTTVKSINFIGNRAFSDSQLKDVITTTETGWFSFFSTTNIYDPDRLNLDRELLRQFYLKNGYADARVVSAVADLDRDGGGFFITFTVEEGELYTFGNVDIQSNLESVDPEALRSHLLTIPGEIYNAAKIDKTIESLTLEAAALGYAFARVRPVVYRDAVARTIDITYVIEKGPRVYIERIDILGNVRTRDYVIRREFRLAEGDAYNRLMVRRARERLMRLGFFKKVDVRTLRGSAPDRVVLQVNVVEDSTGELSFSAGYSTAEGVIGDISIMERNLLGRGQYVRLKLSGSFSRAQVEFSFTEPRFLDRNLAAGFDIVHKEIVAPSSEGEYKNRKTGITLRLGFPLSDEIWVKTRYAFVRDEVWDVTNASQAIKDIEGVSYVSSLGYTVTLDKRNHIRKPTRGYYVRVNQDIAGIGGSVNYVRTTAEARAYYPLTDKITLVGRVTAGNIFGWGGQDVRAVDAFKKGSDIVRGFASTGIGPRDVATGQAIGGTTYASATVEVRFPIPLLSENLGISGAVFADAGTLFGAVPNGGNAVWDDPSIRSSVGFGLLWDSPLGPLRADIAYVLSAESYDDKELFRFGASTQF